MTTIGEDFTESLQAALQGYKDTFGSLDDVADVVNTVSRSLFITWGSAHVGYMEELMEGYQIDDAGGGNVALVHKACGMAGIVPFPVAASSVLQSVYAHTPECSAPLDEQFGGS